MEQHEHDPILSDGLILDEVMPFSWEAAGEIAPPQLALRNERLLRVALTTEEHHRERADEEAEGRSVDLQRLEHKLDLLLELVAGLLAKEREDPAPRRVRMGPRGVAWLETERAPRPGGRLLLHLRPDPALPAPLLLPVEVVAVTPEDGGSLVVTRLLDATLELTEAIERLVFRHHRREVARMRGG